MTLFSDHVHRFNNMYQGLFRGAVPQYQNQKSGPEHMTEWQCDIFDCKQKTYFIPAIYNSTPLQRTVF